MHPRFSRSRKQKASGTLEKLGLLLVKHFIGYRASARSWLEEKLTNSYCSQGIDVRGPHLLYSEMQVFQDSIHSLRDAKDLKTWNVFHTSSTEIKR
jgi:hypothetical protein